MFREEPEFDVRPPRQPVWPWLALAGLLALVLIVWKAGGIRPVIDVRDGVNHPAVGRALETFDLQPLTGDPPPIGPADLAGKVTLVNFWGPWCPPCRDEFPELYDLAQHLSGKPDFRFVSVSCSGRLERDELEVAESTTQFLREKRATLPTYRDAHAKTRLAMEQAALVQNFAYPTTILIGRDGKIRGLWEGYRQGLVDDMLAATLAELKQPAPASVDESRTPVVDSPASE
jgi:cytochrome c biogenesis protein CcmG/thiol:disulfide interchange protein DsbE